MVEETGDLQGYGRGHRTDSRQFAKLQRLINAVKRLGEMNRWIEDFGMNDRCIELMAHYLEVLERDRNFHIPPPYSLEKVGNWIRNESGKYLEDLRKEITEINESIRLRYQQSENRLFQNPSTRSVAFLCWTGEIS